MLVFKYEKIFCSLTPEWGILMYFAQFFCGVNKKAYPFESGTQRRSPPGMNFIIKFLCSNLMLMSLHFWVFPSLMVHFNLWSFNAILYKSWWKYLGSIIGGWKAYYGLENNCKSTELWSWDKKKILFERIFTPIILYGCELWGCSISRESLRKIEKLKNNFITCNIKIKGNTPYTILVLETSCPPLRAWLWLDT